MDEINLIHKHNHKPNGVIKANCEAMKSDDILKRDFTADMPCENMQRILQNCPQRVESYTFPQYYGCYDLTTLGIAMDTNMRTGLCVETLKMLSRLIRI